jgi:hypothetical protein
MFNNSPVWSAWAERVAAAEEVQAGDDQVAWFCVVPTDPGCRDRAQEALARLGVFVDEPGSEGPSTKPADPTSRPGWVVRATSVGDARRLARLLHVQHVAAQVIGIDDAGELLIDSLS